MQMQVWQTDRRVSREAAAIKIGDVRQVYFDFPPFILEGKGVDGLFDVPTLIFKRPNQSMDRPCRLTIQLRSGDEKMFWFNPRYPEKSFGSPFRAVLRMLGDESAKQVHQEVLHIRNRIKAVRGASGREWQNPREVQAIVSELLKVNRSFFEYEKHGLGAPRIVKVLHDKGQLSIGFLVYDKRLINRHKWL